MEGSFLREVWSSVFSWVPLRSSSEGANCVWPLRCVMNSVPTAVPTAIPTVIGPLQSKTLLQLPLLCSALGCPQTKRKCWQGVDNMRKCGSLFCTSWKQVGGFCFLTASLCVVFTGQSLHWSHCRSQWPQTPRDPPASASIVGLKVCATISREICLLKSDY